MEKLFIIGNGFDLDHELKTSYYDFKSYLENELNCKLGCNSIDDSTGNPEYENFYNYSEQNINYFYNIMENHIGANWWSDFENKLSEIEYDYLFDDNITILYDKEGDIDNHTKFNYEDTLPLIFRMFEDFRYIFNEWISSIDIISVKKKKEFNNLIQDNDIFLTFNYTQTLELIYKINPKNICHIHNKIGEELILGHSDINPYSDYDYNDDFWETNEFKDRTHEYLKKDTKECYKNNINFFDKINNINKIYSYGFSYNKVDKVYIQEICKRINKNCIWYLFNYDKDKHLDYQTFIKSCGFKGNFSTFK